MRHPFKAGQNYIREEILPFVGSKQRFSGIVYGAAEPGLVVVFTGSRHGTRAGYLDHWNDDGSFSYCGQGTTGTQRLMGANKVLVDPLRTVLLFETWRPRGTWKGMNRFLGDLLVAGYGWESGLGARARDQLLIVTLVPARSPIDNATQRDSTRANNRRNLEELRQRATDASRSRVPSQISATVYRARSDAVGAYAHARSHGTCEKCGCSAPFVTPNGEPYLEVHHVFRLADDGPDDIFHVAAICPNCHREAHYGADPHAFQIALKELVAGKEQRNLRLKSEVLIVDEGGQETASLT